jgi:hypothetical protein
MECFQCRRTLLTYRSFSTFLFFSLKCIVGSPSAALREIWYAGEVPVERPPYLSLAKRLLHFQGISYRNVKGPENNIELVFPQWRNRPLTLKEIERGLCEFCTFRRIECALVEEHSTGTHRFRFRKSRAHLDNRQQCWKCQRRVDHNHDIVISFCDTCNLGYCNKCDHHSQGRRTMTTRTTATSSSASWICQRCLNFEKDIDALLFANS